MIKQDKIIAVRLDDYTYKTLLEKAKESDRNTSTFIRNAILTTHILPKELNNKDNYKAKIIGAINRVGNNLNQIAYILNVANKNENLEGIDYENLSYQLYMIEQQLNNIINKELE